MAGYIEFEIILQHKDAFGEEPEIVLITGGRTVGKTYGAGKYCLSRYFDNKEEFALLTRSKVSMGSFAVGMLGEVVNNEHPGYQIEEKIRSDRYSTITLVGEEEAHVVGYVIPLSRPGQIKTMSSMFARVETVVFDEFIPEHGESYLSKEPERLLNIITSIARGGGQARRKIRVIMLANKLELANPYFTALVSPDGRSNLAQAITAKTRRYKGPGYVYHMYTDEGIAQQHRDAGINRAFGGLGLDTMTGDGFANDNSSGVGPAGKDWGPFDYFVTVLHNGAKYGLRHYGEAGGLLYLTRVVDTTCDRIMRMTIDGEANTPLLKTHPIGKMIRAGINAGLFRAEDQELKRVAYEFMV